MTFLYKIFGGRKMFIFFLLLVINSIALYIGKWIAEFGYFCVFLYSVIVLGIEGNKVTKTYKDKK